MIKVARRHQPPITIRSERATALLRRLASDGRSQADIIEDALEQMAAQRRTLAQALTPHDRQDFEWEPARSNIAGRMSDFAD